MSYRAWQSALVALALAAKIRLIDNVRFTVDVRLMVDSPGSINMRHTELKALKRQRSTFHRLYATGLHWQF